MLISASFSGLNGPTYAVSSEFTLLPGQKASYSVAGTTEAGSQVILESSLTSGCWDGPSVAFAASTIHAASGTLAPEKRTAYRFRAVVDALATQVAAIVCSITDLDDKAADLGGGASITEGGIMSVVGLSASVSVGAPSASHDDIYEKASGGGVRVDGVLLKDRGVFPRVGAATAPAGLGFGASEAEGLRYHVIDETVSFVDNVALFKALTTPIPAGAVILSVQANVQAALTGGGTTTKVGLGPNASDPDKYGKTSVLTKDAKINTIPTHAVLGAPEAIDICAVADAGAAGNTALTVGSVRVVIVYATADSLANA